MAGYVRYITIDGDTWCGIAAKASGNGSRFDEIIRANPGVPLTPVLKGGIKLRVPVSDKPTVDIDQTLLPPWKRKTITEGEKQAVASIPAFLNPTGSGSFDGSFD